ncbi:MAG TPA: hypothetical protein VGK73_08750 [Polyangiaceae bacterium]
MTIGKCSGIHTRIVERCEYECVECGQRLTSESGPKPLYCIGCAEEMGSCALCGRELEVDE